MINLCIKFLFFRVYCEYNSLFDFAKERESSGETSTPTGEPGEPNFVTPEEQVLHFLARAGRPRWKWMSVRPRSSIPHFAHSAAPVGNSNHHLYHGNNNGQNSRKAEPYYCDRYLVQSLVRDAMVTDGLDSDKPSHLTRNENKQ